VAEGLILVWRTDAHLSDFAPESRVDDWALAILGKLAQVGEIARKAKASGILDGGDLFHVKTPSRNSHGLVGRVAAVHAANPCPTWATIGNHDVKYGNSEFLEENPLGVLFESGVLRRLYGPHEAFFEKGGVTVRVVGIPYHGTEYDMSKFSTLQKGAEDYLVVVAHCLASRTGRSMYEKEDVLKYSDLLAFAPDVFCFGHSHSNQGIEEIAPGKWIINTGSLSRGALNQDDINRVPSCVVLKFTKTEIKVVPIPLKVAPASEVFNLEGHQRSLEQDISMEQFVDSLKEVLSDRSKGSVLESVRDMPGIDDEVRERAVHYLERSL